MSRLTKIRANRQQRMIRTRRRIRGTGDRPRLSVYISLKHIYAQVINDETGATLVSASTLKLSRGQNLSQQAEIIGNTIAQECKKAKIERVVLDRGRRLYHGRLKILSQAARDKGLKF